MQNLSFSLYALSITNEQVLAFGTESLYPLKHETVESGSTPSDYLIIINFIVSVLLVLCSQYYWFFSCCPVEKKKKQWNKVVKKKMTTGSSSTSREISFVDEDGDPFCVVLPSMADGKGIITFYCISNMHEY